MAPIRPFEIDIPDASLDRLRQKLELADFPEEPEAGSDYGATVYVQSYAMHLTADFYDDRLTFPQL